MRVSVEMMKATGCVPSTLGTALVLALGVLGACGKKADGPNGPGSNPSGSNAVNGGSNGSGAGGGLNEADPATAVVMRAFHGKKPTFPSLSKDGATAAVELTTPIGLSGASSYAVGFATVGADDWSGGPDPDLVTLVDGKLVAVLLDSMEGSAAPTIDIDSITKAATSVTDRIARDGFTPFEGTINEVGVHDKIGAGALELRVIEEGNSALTIEISDATKKIATDKVEPVAMGRVGDIECMSLPHVRRAWFDSARKRLLVQVGWNAGPDQCNAPDEKFRLYGPR